MTFNAISSLFCNSQVCSLTFCTYRGIQSIRNSRTNVSHIKIKTYPYYKLQNEQIKKFDARPVFSVHNLRTSQQLKIITVFFLQIKTLSFYTQNELACRVALSPPVPGVGGGVRNDGYPPGGRPCSTSGNWLPLTHGWTQVTRQNRIEQNRIDFFAAQFSWKMHRVSMFESTWSYVNPF